MFDPANASTASSAIRAILEFRSIDFRWFLALVTLIVALCVSGSMAFVLHLPTRRIQSKRFTSFMLARSIRNSSRRHKTPTTLRSSNEESPAKKPVSHVYTARDRVPRYAGPLSNLTKEQEAIRDTIQATRPRTGLAGPFGPWLAVPSIAGPAQELGRACRYETSLSFRESELVILLTGAKTRSHAEFDIHVDEALKAGLSMEVIQAIPRDDNFDCHAVATSVLPLLVNERDRAVVSFAAELLETYSVTEETYAATKAAVGGDDTVLVEITSIVGYYTYVSYTLNAFQIPSK